MKGLLSSTIMIMRLHSVSTAIGYKNFITSRIPRYCTIIQQPRPVTIITGTYGSAKNRHAQIFYELPPSTGAGAPSICWRFPSSFVIGLIPSHNNQINFLCFYKGPEPESRL